MSDPNIPNESGARELIALPDALRALPLAAPRLSAWPQLAATLNAQSRPARSLRRHSWRIPTVLAAGVVLAFAAFSLLRAPAPHDASMDVATKSGVPASSVHNATNDTHAMTSANAEDINTLQARSRALEHWLHDTSKASGPQSAQDLVASAEIEDMIGLVDVQLATPDANAALPLWHRRVALLEDLTTLRYSANLVQFESGFAANAATRATWNN